MRDKPSNYAPIARVIAGRIHVGESERYALEFGVSRIKGGRAAFLRAPRSSRRAFLRAMLRAHRANRKLYREVMLQAPGPSERYITSRMMGGAR